MQLSQVWNVLHPPDRKIGRSVRQKRVLVMMVPHTPTTTNRPISRSVSHSPPLQRVRLEASCPSNQGTPQNRNQTLTHQPPRIRNSGLHSAGTPHLSDPRTILTIMSIRERLYPYYQEFPVLMRHRSQIQFFCDAPLTFADEASPAGQASLAG